MTEKNEFVEEMKNQVELILDEEIWRFIIKKFKKIIEIAEEEGIDLEKLIKLSKLVEKK